ncbi:RecF/RecN/SMC [Obelidium mucronatum]|nr:RecF/RecN/SMC [Obelidium mucronatum]
MCHQFLEVDFCPNINFVIGHNGSGKSAILTGIMVCLGGKAKTTDRADSLKSLVMEGQNAGSVRVAIHNKGFDAFKPEIYGQTIQIERKISKDGSGSYRIMDEIGTTQAHTKEELTAILDHMSISIDNPLNILTQDTSRQFLANSTPKDKYDFFSRGTLLTQLSEDHQFIDGCIKTARTSFERREALLPELKDAYKEAKAVFDEVKKFEGLENEINSLKEQLTWAIVEEREAILVREKRGLLLVEKKRDERSAQLEENQENLDLQFERKRTKEIFLEAMKTDNDPLHVRFQEAKEQMAALQEERQKFEEGESHAQSMLRGATRSRDAMQAKIDQETRKLGGLDRDARERKVAEIERLREEKAAAGNRALQITEELETLDASKLAVEGRISHLREQISRLKHSIESEGTLCRQMEQSNYDRITAYGNNMPHVLREIEAIKQQRGWRGDTPLGPLGIFIKLKEPEFKKTIEAVLGPLLRSFVVDTVEDRDQLRAIFNRHRCNILMQDKKEFNITGGEPHPDVLTFYRAMEIKEPVVMRQLVIHRNIEKLGLVHTKHEGDRLATSGENRAMPRNLMTVYTVDNVQIGGHGGDVSAGSRCRAGNKVPTIFNHSEKSFTFFLIGCRERRTTIDRLTHDLKELNQQLSQTEEECNGFIRQIFTLKNDKQQTTRLTFQLENNIKKLQDDMIEEEPAQISIFEEKKQEAEDEMKLYQVQADDLRGSKLRISKDIRVRHTEMTHMRRDNLREIEEDIQKLERTRYDIQAKHREMVTRAESLQAIIAQLEEEIHTEIEQALEITNGQRIETHGQTPDKIGQILRNKEVALREAVEFTGSKEKAISNLNERHQILNDAEKELQSVDALLIALEQAMQVRMNDWEILRSKISKRAKNTFTMMMNMRGFQGKVLLDHEHKTLDLKVDVHNLGGSQVKNNKEKDPKTLSGGEKSFSTVCLLLSLWESMGNPFRALDEFDVFMDAVNRRISMQNMIRYARRGGSLSQYIFITPQDMSHVPDMNGKDVRVHKLRDPERNQARLNFARV